MQIQIPAAADQLAGHAEFITQEVVRVDGTRGVELGDSPLAARRV
jgi:hypothetical protein